MPLPHEPGPHWGEVGIHGLHRPREWDQIVTVEADLPGEEVWLVALPGGRVVVEQGERGHDVNDLLAGIGLPRPFRARAVRRGRTTWAVAARRIQIAELRDDPGGCDVELVWDGTERSVRVDDEPTLADAPELEALGRERHATYVVRASRLEGATWEIEVTAL